MQKIMQKKHLSKIITFILLDLLLGYTVLYSFFDTDKTKVFENEYLTILSYHSPLIETGTHINSLGWQMYYQLVSVPKNTTGSVISKKNHHLLINLAGKANINNLGIPGYSLNAEGSIRYIYSFGKKNYSYYLKQNSIFISKTHNISFAFNYYLTTDKTSQPSGTLYYEYLKEKSFFGIEFENDILVSFSDKYRTGALELRYGRKLKKTKKYQANKWITFALGFIIWVGERKIERWQLDREVDIPLFYGKEYSHGILYTSLKLNDIELSLGYDSEKIRNAIQNNFHFLIGDGKIPIINREERWLLQIKFYDMGTLY